MKWIRIITEETFLKSLKPLARKYRSMKEDLKRLQEELTANPFLGTDLGKGVRKVRMAIGSKNKGKSHGARVITYAYTLDEAEGVIHLLFIYDKAERGSISAAEIEALLAEVRETMGDNQ